ncbi:RNA polymerase subunit sigma-70 [Maricaulis sp. W15]|uniref:RNA polymerase sigma-70 factor (ECF subfamily) n=1 Tax=Maricaulis maris TaxID=74318 RepID=A0A495DDT3_9PROT|nr:MULTISPECIES: sigma-70 family RNA polymerase sigma factor [Maricaulis]OLF78279.1 RNA polymerase subunit sigma-70 [Maricaulis sp. W15]RKR00498.1 RNA polymerase sigma-70 factor (ECF subfamily) [Maricaulis maris]
MGKRSARLENEMIEYLPRMRRFARSLSRDAADADDLVQLTVERALTRLDQWQDGTRLDSWMYRIMKNAWIDETRRRQRQGRHLAPPEAGESVGAEDPDFDKRIRAMSVERAMATLPDDQRIAVGLVLVEGLSYKEASNVLDVPMGTLTSRLARGRKALEAQLNPDSVEAGHDD